MLTTTLGSCVSVCLWDPMHRFGGMNHFVLPTDPALTHNTRYGDAAMELLVWELVNCGSKVRALQAKVFGGASVLPCRPGRSVGDDNVLCALSLLHGNGIPVVAQRTGGLSGQQIRFHTATGDVMIRMIKAAPQKDMAAFASRR